MSRRQYDPLKTIPAASILRERLEQLEEESRRVRIVLHTAEQIERQRAESQPAQGARVKTAERSTAGLGEIRGDAAYPLPLFKALTALDSWALRQARKAGLRMRTVGRRKFILGNDWLAFLATLTDTADQ